MTQYEKSPYQLPSLIPYQQEDDGSFMVGTVIPYTAHSTPNFRIISTHPTYPAVQFSCVRDHFICEEGREEWFGYPVEDKTPFKIIIGDIGHRSAEWYLSRSSRYADFAPWRLRSKYWRQSNGAIDYLFYVHSVLATIGYKKGPKGSLVSPAFNIYTEEL